MKALHVKREREGRKGDKDFERQGGRVVEKRAAAKCSKGRGERRGSNALNSGLGEVQWLRGFLTRKKTRCTHVITKYFRHTGTTMNVER